MVLSEKAKMCNGLTISHLQQEEGHVSAGPTAFFKLSNVVTGKNLPKHGRATSHTPELNLHGFGTRLGHRIGRFLGSLFPHCPQHEGRQVVTFHNQRDYLFVRHHRYVFFEGKEEDEESKLKKTRARLQELGPRFTLKLRWLQEGMIHTLETMSGITSERRWIQPEESSTCNFALRLLPRWSFSDRCLALCAF
jgi:ribosome production factor 1